MRYILFLLTVIVLFSCEEKSIKLFNESNQVYFDKFYVDEYTPGTALADSTVVSYFFYPTNTQDIEAKIIVCLAGKLLKKDAHFGLKVIEKGTTADPSEYTINDSYTFHANNIKAGDKRILDTISVKFHKSDRLENLDEGIRLVVELVPSEDLALGQIERRRAIIICSTKTSKPDWWDDEVEDNLLGAYTQTKYKAFLDNVDVNAEFNRQLITESPDKAIQFAYKFKQWLNEQDPKVIDEDGSEMTLPI